MEALCRAAVVANIICIIFIMVQVSNLHEDKWVTLDFFIMAQVGNLHKDQGVILYFFIMVEVGNLDMFRGLLQSIFIMAEVGNLLGKITDLMVIIIRVVGWMAGCF